MTDFVENLQKETSTASSPRVEWVDKARGLCIFLVVMMHTTLGIEKLTGDTGWMHAVVAFAQPFRMPDFFLISGLFLAATIDRPWRLYLDRKVVHFFYFYILWVLIQFAMRAPFMVTDGQTVPMVLRSLLFTLVQPFGTLWFIYMLPVFFVVTKLFRKSPWLLLAAAAVLQILPINTSDLLQSITSTLGVVSVDTYWVLIDEFCSFYVYFLAGYLFAGPIFKLAEQASRNRMMAWSGLALWFCINLSLVQLGWSGLPLVSLMLGGMGAMAIVTFASLLVRIGGTNLLSHMGANSIVVYLAFFVPMIIGRLTLYKFAPELGSGNMAALTTVFAAMMPLLGWAIIQRIGFGYFLFRRPQWAMLSAKPGPAAASLQPAR